MKVYGKLEYCHTRLYKSSPKWLVSKLEPHVSIRFKHLFPSISQSSCGPFLLNDNHNVAADLIWFISRYNLLIDNASLLHLKNQTKRFYEDQAEGERINLPNYQPTERIGLHDGQLLRKYQLVALDLISHVNRLLLIDDIGLGKTYEALGIALIPGALPLVIVVEPHLSQQWLEKANAFINLKVCKVNGNKPYDLPPADIYIFKYTQLSPWVDVLASGWVKAIAFDEIQMLRTGAASARGEAAESICQNVPFVVGLTATLIYNYGIEAWNILNIVRPGLLGNKYEFLREWCSDDHSGKGIVKDPDALGAYLKEMQATLRRTKADVGQEAKQRAPHLEWVEPNLKAVKETEELAKSLAIKTLTAGFAEAGQAAREFDLKMREMTGIAKASQVAAYTRMFIETGTPIILFGWHHEVYRIWEKELADLNPLFFTGKQTAIQKEKNKKAFIDGESKLLIMSLRSGAGTDGLQHTCSTVIHGEFDWSPQVHKQCTGRVDRDGQTDPVYVFYVCTEFGSDPAIIDTLGVKTSQGHGITDPGTTPIKQQSDGNRIKLLAESFLKSRGITPPPKQKDDAQLSIAELADAI